MKESECDLLRRTINEREVQVKLLKEQLAEIMGCSRTPCYSYSPIQPSYLQTTARNYLVVPTPNPATQFAFQEAPFREKIDYSKIQLRKTPMPMDEEKRSATNAQEDWAYRQSQQQFMRKLQEASKWQGQQFPPVYRSNASPVLYGGAPSNIYPETLNKVGNLAVPAFTTKLNLSDMPQQLGKRA